VVAPASLVAEPEPAAIAGFKAYIAQMESRLARQHSATNGFLAPAKDSQSETRLRSGELIVERVTSSSGVDLPGAMLHHWRGTAFVPRGTAADFERFMKDFNAYPQQFSPQVLQATALPLPGSRDDHFQVTMRVLRHYVITVVLDTAYDVIFSRIDPQHGYSISRSTRISEIESPGTPKEHALSPTEDHGFLWRLNTYWTYEERDGGLYMQIETISLSRSIPRGLGWAVGPFVEKVPRESLEATLRSTCSGLRK
jgi:hypothetical protein